MICSSTVKKSYHLILYSLITFVKQAGSGSKSGSGSEINPKAGSGSEKKNSDPQHCITIKKGSGQGYPISSILFLISSEPLNRLFAKAILHLIYITMEGATVGLLLFADNNLTTPSNCSSWSETAHYLCLNWIYRGEWTEHQPSQNQSTLHQHPRWSLSSTMTDGDVHSHPHKAFRDLTGHRTWLYCAWNPCCNRA